MIFDMILKGKRYENLSASSPGMGRCLTGMTLFFCKKAARSRFQVPKNAVITFMTSKYDLAENFESLYM